MAVGVGDGVGPGASEPLGVSVCAWTDEDAVAMMKTKAIAAATTSLRQVPVSFACESRDGQHMNAISKKQRWLGKKCKIPRAQWPICAQFPGSVNRPWSLKMGDCRT